MLTKYFQISSSQPRKDYFAELDSYSSVSTGDPIDEWLSTPALTHVSDGLSWWTAMIQTKHPLARMALDFLSAPGIISYLSSNNGSNNGSILATSTDVERAFSSGGLTVSKMRHSLSDESTRAATVLGSWCNFPQAIPRDDIIAAFRDKNKRPKGGQGKEVSNPEVVITSDVE